MKRIREYAAKFSAARLFGRRRKMTCPVRPSRGPAPVVVPSVAHYTRNFHAPVFKTVSVVSTVTVVILPAPLKIVYRVEDDV